MTCRLDVVAVVRIADAAPSVRTFAIAPKDGTGRLDLVEAAFPLQRAALLEAIALGGAAGPATDPAAFAALGVEGRSAWGGVEDAYVGDVGIDAEVAARLVAARDHVAAALATGHAVELFVELG